MSEELKSRYELFLEEEERQAQPTKSCPHCKETKGLSEFAKTRDGHKNNASSWCLKCRRAKRKYKDANDLFWKHFWARTRRDGDCLVWAGKIRGGMPVCQRDKKSVSVRRLVYRLAVGELPDDMRVIMKCKTKHCVSQYHMKNGTKEDLYTKLANCQPTGISHYSRHHLVMMRGENNPAAKLDEQKVRAIREMYIPRKMSCTMVAAKFGVAPSLIGMIVRREIWAHVQ